ncbi:hypothetical protein LA76x_1120 [Lysobacter antibioticus]|uniref:Uncharacterized protein n=1 Tax=Lysobacter antibioticus TaxID=84531 RepID=A0A0S2F6W8_LYSAN|nr:hypothetical protein LA76x_1120 [Lysobacter antibioticus]
MDRSTRNRFCRLWHGRPHERRSATAVTRRSGDGGRGLGWGCPRDGPEAAEAPGWERLMQKTNRPASKGRSGASRDRVTDACGVGSAQTNAPLRALSRLQERATRKEPLERGHISYRRPTDRHPRVGAAQAATANCRQRPGFTSHCAPSPCRSGVSRDHGTGSGRTAAVTDRSSGLSRVGAAQAATAN